VFVTSCWVWFSVGSYQRLKKWYLLHLLL